jgi:hypothetical protein
MAGAGAMPTPKELRLQAQECLELAKATTEYYARNALADLARRLSRDARQAERRERDLALYSNCERHAR